MLASLLMRESIPKALPDKYLTQPLRILVVDDYEPFRRYLCATLEQQAGIQVVGQASDGLEAVQKAEELQPGLILLDINLPKLNGLQAAKRVGQLAPLARILFISYEFSIDLVDAAIRAGAAGYLHKLRAHGELMRAIEAIRHGRYFVSGVVREGFGQTTIDNRPRHHEVQWCSNDAVFRESFTDFIAATLRADKAAILIATESHRADVLQGLRAQKLDVDGAIQRGSLIPLDVTETLSTIMLDEVLEPARLFDAAGGLIEASARAAKREQDPRVAVCRECPSFLLVEGKWAEALRLEQLWDLIAYTSGFNMLCGYESARWEKHKNIFQSICAEHSAVYSR